MIKTFMAGTFDWFHRGHLNAIKQAASFGDYLMVGVCSDKEVTRYKRLPTICQEDRLAIVASIKDVDEAFIVDDCFPDKKFFAKHPFHIYTLNDEEWNSNPDFIRCEREMTELGVTIRYFKRTAGISTSLLLKRLTD